MTFTTTRLVNNRVSVRGTDINGVEGQCVLDSRQWDELAERAEYQVARAKFDEATRAFYEPLNKATEQLEAAQAGNEPDELTFIELEPGEEHVVGRTPQRVYLTHDSQVLRLLGGGNTDRLVWVGDQLEIVETGATVQQAIANVEKILGGVEVDEPEEPGLDQSSLPADASLG